MLESPHTQAQVLPPEGLPEMQTSAKAFPAEPPKGEENVLCVTWSRLPPGMSLSSDYHQKTEVR